MSCTIVVLHLMLIVVLHSVLNNSSTIVNSTTFSTTSGINISSTTF